MPAEKSVQRRFSSTCSLLYWNSKRMCSFCNRQAQKKLFQSWLVVVYGNGPGNHNVLYYYQIRVNYYWDWIPSQPSRQEGSYSYIKQVLYTAYIKGGTRTKYSHQWKNGLCSQNGNQSGYSKTVTEREVGVTKLQKKPLKLLKFFFYVSYHYR